MIGDFRKMPERQLDDADPQEAYITRIGPNHLHVHYSDKIDFIVSEYTAARLCGGLMLFLGLRLIARHGRRLLL